MSKLPDETLAPDALQEKNITPSNLALRRVAIDTYRENVAYLHRDCAVYRAEGFQALSKVEVRANGRRILATLNVVDDESIVSCHELGLSEDAVLQLAVKDGTAPRWHRPNHPHRLVPFAARLPGSDSMERIFF